MSARFTLLVLIVACVVALAGCSEGGRAIPSSQLNADSPTGSMTGASGAWLDAPGKVQVYNYLVDRSQPVTVDLYWSATELIDGIREVQHTEKYATLAYGEHTEVMKSRHFGRPGDEVEELEYVAVPVGTPVAAVSETKIGDAETVLSVDLYQSHSDAATAYLNGGGTVVDFLSPATNGAIEARPRIQSFYADLYPSGEVNHPPPAADLPKAGPGQVVLPVGFLFGTEGRAETGRLADLRGWRWSADGDCLPEDGNHSYGGDGADWMWLVPQTASISIHPEFHTDPADVACANPGWPDALSLTGKERPFALIVPTTTGEPRAEIIEVP